MSTALSNVRPPAGIRTSKRGPLVCRCLSSAQDVASNAGQSMIMQGMACEACLDLVAILMAFTASVLFSLIQPFAIAQGVADNIAIDAILFMYAFMCATCIYKPWFNESIPWLHTTFSYARQRTMSAAAYPTVEHRCCCATESPVLHT